VVLHPQRQRVAWFLRRARVRVAAAAAAAAAAVAAAAAQPARPAHTAFPTVAAARTSVSTHTHTGPQGDAKSSLCDAMSSLGDAKISRAW
jgi:hypothetical protein